jgi:hypothetical protein|tara:strand:- start:2563 stop:3585 length:1023 start_codon:yes stop_codon:yes gene_type:complete
MGILDELLKDPQFLLGAGLLTEGAKGKSPGEAVMPALLQTAQLKKAFTPTLGKTKSVTDTKTFDDKGKPINTFATESMIQAEPGRYVPIEKTPLVKFSGPEIEKQYDKDRAKQQANKYKVIQDKAVSASDAKTNYAMVTALSENVNTGAFGEQLLGLAKFGKRIGINTDWLTKTDENGNVGIRDAVGNAEALEVLQVQFALEKIQKTKGAISDTEFKKFLGTSPGLSMTKEGIQLLSTVNEALADRDIKIAGMAAAWEADNGRLTSKGKTEYGNLSFDEYINKWRKDPTNAVVSEEFMKKLEEVSGSGEELEEEKNVRIIGGVKYRKLSDGTIIRIGGKL